MYVERKQQELETGIPYPFYTLKDDNYAAFVTKILHHLELRRFSKCDIIHQELDQCMEIIFVQTGKYCYGYEVNKKKIYRIQFGPSTIIGGF